MLLISHLQLLWNESSPMFKTRICLKSKGLALGLPNQCGFKAFRESHAHNSTRSFNALARARTKVHSRASFEDTLDCPVRLGRVVHAYVLPANLPLHLWSDPWH